MLSGAVLGARIGRSPEWIEARTGIRELRTLAPGEQLIDLAIRAAREALADAHPTRAHLDLVIAASCSVDNKDTSIAGQIANTLAPGAAAIDLNAACAGFSYALANADALIRSGAAQGVLIIAAEQMTSIVDPHDLATSIIFGDGAGAAWLDVATDDTVHLGPVSWGSDGANAELITIPPDKRYLRMTGQQVFRWVIERMQRVAEDACRRAGVRTADIDVFVPHQANARIVDALTSQLGLQHAVVSRDVTTSGNTSAASIPIALSKLIRAGSARSGQLALLIGYGAGLTYAAQVLRLP